MTAPAAIATQAATKSAWKIDTTHTHAEFAVRHLMISTVKGRFADVQGVVHIDESDFTKSDVQVTIGVASIDTREAQRDAHLKSADFFDVEKFPKLVFKSKRIAEAKGDILDDEFSHAGALQGGPRRQGRRRS